MRPPPAALVDVVDVEVAEQAPAGPEEAVELLHLVHQLADLAVVGPREAVGDRAVHAVAAHGDDVADLAELDALEEFAARVAVAAHQPHAYLEVLVDRLIRQREHLARARPVHRDGLFHEDVEALVNSVFEVNPAKRRGRGQDHDVAGLEAIHRLLVAVEADETPFGWDVHVIAEALLHAVIVHLEIGVEDVGHRDQLDRAAGGRKRVEHRSPAAPAAADQCQADRFIAGGVDGRDDDAR